jgi:hypothetical protein
VISHGVQRVTTTSNRHRRDQARGVAIAGARRQPRSPTPASDHPRAAHARARRRVPTADCAERGWASTRD